jgi:hypothetical protein
MVLQSTIRFILGIQGCWFIRSSNRVRKPLRCTSPRPRYLPYIRADKTYYDYFDHSIYKGKGYHKIPLSLDKIPVFVRGGSIIPRKDRIRGSTARMARDPYTLFITLSDEVSSPRQLMSGYRRRRIVYRRRGDVRLYFWRAHSS